MLRQDIPDLQSIQSDDSSTTSVDSIHYNEYNQMLDNMVSYCDELKQHNKLVEMIQSLVISMTSSNTSKSFIATPEPENQRIPLYIYTVTIHAQQRVAKPANETVEEPPSETPPPEPSPATPSTPHANLTDLEDEIF